MLAKGFNTTLLKFKTVLATIHSFCKKGSYIIDVFFFGRIKIMVVF